MKHKFLILYITTCRHVGTVYIMTHPLCCMIVADFEPGYIQLKLQLSKHEYILAQIKGSYINHLYLNNQIPDR
jgi:hypothetical protein